MDRPPPDGLSRSPARDDLQVGAFFGLVAGVVALLVALLLAVLSGLAGVSVQWRGQLLAHAALLPLYALAGALIGARWSWRATPGGHFGLRCLAATAVAATVASVTLGPVWRWPAAQWPRVLLLIPAFAWVFGGRRRAARTPSPEP